MILTRSTRFVQPLGPVELDTSNPLTRGVVVAWVPGSSRNIQDGKPASVNGVLSVGPYGYMQATTGTQKAFLVPDAPAQRTPTFTSYAILRRVEELPSYFDGVGKIWKSNAGPTYVSDSVSYNIGAGQNSIRAVFGRAGGNTTTAVYSGQETTEWHSIASTHNGSTGSLYVSGVLRASVAVQPVVYGASGDNSFGTNASGKSGGMEYALVLRWNRALSAGEIASIEANPWQLFRPVQRRIYFDMGAGGGTSPVSSDQSASYAIRGSVSSDQAASYAIRSSVNADLSASYNIQTASAVSSDLSSGYEIRTSAQSDVSAEYAIRASVQADSSAAYAIRSSVQADAGAAFFVRGAVLSDASASYLVRTNVSADLSAAYEIQTASGVAASLDASYNVRAAVQSDASAAYDLRTAVGATSEHAFMVRGLVSSDLDASYTVDASLVPVYADMQAAYLVDGGAVFIPSQFVASVPAGVFSARAPSGEYSATVPAGIFKASI